MNAALDTPLASAPSAVDRGEPEPYWAKTKVLASEHGLTLPDLREHQKEGYLSIRNAVKKGDLRNVLMAPCSYGKTVLAAYMACQSVIRNKRVMFCVDNLELVSQTIETFERCGLEVGVVQGNHPQFNPSARVQIATIQTINARLTSGKDGWADTRFDLIFIDETHAWHKGIDLLGVVYPNAVFVGMTATPWRIGMGQFYQSIVSTITVSELLDMGWLTPIDVYSHPCPSWAGVKTSKGDYVLTEAAKEYTPELIGNVVDTWEETCADLSTIVFSCDKAHASAMAAEFCARGHVFVAVDGDTDTDDRKEIIRRFKSGDIQGISTCLIAIKGFDATIAACMVDVQPTKSKMRHYQKIGRIQRIHDGKERSVALDFAGNFIRNGRPTDELPVELNDGTKESKDNNSPLSDDEPLSMPCSACNFLKPPKTITCPACGFKPTRMESREHIAGVLELLTGETRHAERIPWDESDKREWYKGMLFFAWQCDYKPGWAKYAFQARFNEMPIGYPTNRGNKRPPIEIVKWCESYQRKKSEEWKAKKRAEGKEAPAELMAQRQAKAIARSRNAKRAEQRGSR